MEERRLIVNADDFGMSRGINEGVIQAHVHGIVTSTSLMVRWPDGSEAARLAGGHPALSVGLHVDLGEWVWHGGRREPLYVVADPTSEYAVLEEIERQLDTFRAMVGKEPTHLDSHQHVHRMEPVRSVMSRVAARLGIPARELTPGITLCTEFYGQTGYGEPAHELITAEHLIAILERLPAGTTELMCHAGHGAGLATIYRTERDQELAVLCDPRVRDAIEAAGIRLISFADVVSPTRSTSS